MANCVSAVTGTTGGFGRLARLLMIYAGLVLLAGCEAVPMPDLGKFDFNLGQEKPMVAIKPSQSKVNIRPTPSTQLAPVASLAGGNRLQLLDEQGDWLKVSFFDTAGKEQVGWIYKYLVEGYEKPAGSAATVQPRADSPQSEPEDQATPDSQALPKSQAVSPL